MLPPGAFYVMKQPWSCQTPERAACGHTSSGVATSD